MKNTRAYWQLVGFFFTAVMGTLLHFLFDWAEGNKVVALFSAVNESIWEHLKLLFYPVMVFAVAEYFAWGKELPSFWWVKLLGIALGLVLIPVMYYTYTGIFGVNVDWLNIAIFFLVAGAVFRIESKLFERDFAYGINPRIAVLLIGLVAVLFAVFTFHPPHIPLFQDPMTYTYGFQK